MSDVPHKAYDREYPGTKSDAVIARICPVLEGDYLLYAAPDRMFDALIAMRGAARSDDERKPIDELTRRFAQHDRRAWQQVGPGVQRLLVDRIAELTDPALCDAAASVTIMLRETLSSTVTGTSWQADTMLLHTNSVAVTDDLKTIRGDALDQLERLHALLPDDPSRANVRGAMLAAGNTPNNSGYSDQLGEVIMDLTRVMGFFEGAVPELGLEARRQIEVAIHRLYYAYHALPAGMVKNPQLIAAQARLLAATAACRAVLEGDPDFARYRLLIGYDSITPAMWAKPGFDYQIAATERSEGIDGLVASVSAQTADEWLARIEYFVESRSNDGAFFLGVQEFIKKLAQVQPEILLKWMPKLSDRLANWLPGILHGLWEAGHGALVDPLIEAWVSEDRHLFSIAYYLQFAEVFRLDLLLAITARALATGDEAVLANVAETAARQSAKHPEHLFDDMFLPAAKALSARKIFSWVSGLFNWSQLGLLKGLSSEQVEQLLALLVDVPRLGNSGEAMLAVLAAEHVEAVINLIGARFEYEHSTGDFRYEDLPYSLHYLRQPLAAAPGEIVATARKS